MAQSTRVEIAVARDRARAAGAILAAIAQARAGDIHGAKLMLDTATRLAELVPQLELADRPAAMAPATDDAMRRAHETATQVLDTRQ